MLLNNDINKRSDLYVNDKYKIISNVWFVCKIQFLSDGLRPRVFLLTKLIHCQLIRTPKKKMSKENLTVDFFIIIFYF